MVLTYYLFTVLVFAFGFLLGQKSVNTFHWRVLNQMDRQINRVRQEYVAMLENYKQLEKDKNLDYAKKLD